MDEKRIEQYSTGFDYLHRMGIQGTGQNIIILEPNFTFSQTHPAFSRSTVKCHDVGRHPYCPSGFQDRSSFRYEDSKSFFLRFHDDQDHAQQVLGIVIGRPSTQHNYGGGISPKASAIMISFSDTGIIGKRNGWSHSPIESPGSALYSFSDVAQFFLRNEDRDALQGFTSPYQERCIDLYNSTIDDSIFHAFNLAFQSPGRVINASFGMGTPLDPKNFYKLPESFLEFLSNGLEKSDKILLFSTGNNGVDISECIRISDEKKGIHLLYSSPDFLTLDFYKRMQLDEDHVNYVQQREKAVFFQYATHPRLKKRIRIIANARVLPENNTDHSDSYTALDFKNGQHLDVCLAKNSNYPGGDMDLQAITYTDFGTNIMVAAKLDNFILSSGTSLSTPRVGGLLTLMDEYYTQQGKNYSGIELIEILDASCLLPTSELAMYYGKGFPDPLTALGIAAQKDDDDACVLL